MRLGSHFISFIAAACLASAGCMGGMGQTGDDSMADDDDSPPPPPPTPDAAPPQSAAEQLFEANVQPYLALACASCHAGTGITPLKFLGTGPASEYYTTLVANGSVHGGFNPALAQIIIKGEHENGLARALTQEEKDRTTEWLLLEANERGIDLDDNGAPPPATEPANSREMLAKWAGCMTLQDWTDSQMGQWANKGSNQGQCNACHSDGAGLFFAPNNNELMFNMNRTELYIRSFFTVQVSPTGTMTVIMNMDKFRAKANTTGHPNFNAGNNNTQVQYLNDFYNRTMARWTAGTCGPPGFYLPTP